MDSRKLKCKQGFKGKTNEVLNVMTEITCDGRVATGNPFIFLEASLLLPGLIVMWHVVCECV